MYGECCTASVCTLLYSGTVLCSYFLKVEASHQPAWFPACRLNHFLNFKLFTLLNVEVFKENPQQCCSSLALVFHSGALHVRSESKRARLLKPDCSRNQRKNLN